MVIAQQRSELIEKSLVARQAQYIFICLRQAILNFPTLYARRVVGIADEHQAKQVLTNAAHEFLTELADFPNKTIHPNWLQSIEGDGQGQDDGGCMRANRERDRFPYFGATRCKPVTTAP